MADELNDTDLKQLAIDLKKAADEVKDAAEKTNTEVKNLGKVTEETKKVADDAMVKHNEISARITEIEQKLDRKTKGDDDRAEARKSVGRIVTESQELKDWLGGARKGTFSMEVKAIISALTTDADGSAGDLIVPDRRGLILPVQRRMTIRDLLTPGNTGSNAIQYLFASPVNGADPRLWRLPVVETQAMTVDKFLTGAFQLGAQVFDREDANVEISTEDSDNFRKNLVTIRAEERLALAVYRTEAFVKGDFSDALAA